MAKEIEILIFDFEDHPIKRKIDVDKISYFINAADSKHPKRILINAPNYCDYAPYTMDEFLRIIGRS